MELNKIKLFIQDQFPEFYQEEFPQLVSFITKYYEYLEGTNYSVKDSFKDIDETLDSYVALLKQNFAVNIPEFGKLPDREFLLFAKEFYTSRGSKDSYRFLFRALYGKEIDILYPGESILRASDGTWNQEVSIRIVSTDNALNLIGKSFVLSSPTGAKTTIECHRVNNISSGVFDVFIDRNYRGLIRVNDTIDSFGVQATVVEIPSRITVLKSGGNFVNGTLFTVPSLIPLRFKIKKVGNTGNILFCDIVQPGFDLLNNLDSPLRKYFVVDSVDRTFFQSTTDSNFPISGTQALLSVQFNPALVYPGVYTSSRGFLSDAIKLQDNNFYQTFSYVIRLDEQLESYKSIVKRLLHPAGMALWAEYNISSNLNLKAKIRAVVEKLKLFVEDDVISLDDLSFDYVLDRKDSVVSQEQYTFHLERPVQETLSPTPDSGFIKLYKTGLPSYAEPSYFAETQLIEYTEGSTYFLEDYVSRTIPYYSADEIILDIKVLHPWKVRPVDDAAVVTDVVEINKIKAVNEIVSANDSAIFENIFQREVSENINLSEIVTITVSQPDMHYAGEDYFLEEYTDTGSLVIIV